MGRVIKNDSWEKTNKLKQLRQFFVACDIEHRETDFETCDYLLVGKSQHRPDLETRVRICWSKLWEFEDRIPWHCNAVGARLPLWLSSKFSVETSRYPFSEAQGNQPATFYNLQGVTIAKPIGEFVRSSKICTYTVHESLDNKLVVGYRFYDNVLYFPAPSALTSTLIDWAISNNRLLRYSEKSRKGPLKQNNKNNVISIQTGIS